MLLNLDMTSTAQPTTHVTFSWDPPA